MAARISPQRLSSGLGRADALRAFVAYALIGFANIILPSIIFACSYLIIPYPRAAVVLIEALPALAAKLVFSQLIHHVPYWLRPVAIASFWSLAGVVTWATPPNIEAPLRVLVVTIAAATAAVTDVWMMGMLRYYRRPGIAGWGVGTGIGYIATALIPFVLTMRMRSFLRASLDFVSYLVPILPVAYYIVLPSGPRNASTANKDWVPKRNRASSVNEEGLSLLMQESPRLSHDLQARLSENITILKSLFKPYMIPLYFALISQTIAFPGLTRAQPTSSHYVNFTAYACAYGVAFHVGNLLGRATILVKRFQKYHRLLIPLRIVTIIALVNALLMFFSAPFIVLGITASVGFFSGMVYVNTIAAAVDTLRNDEVPTQYEKMLGMIGVGDAIGVLVGGLTGVILENTFCEMGLGWGERWCYRPG